MPKHCFSDNTRLRFLTNAGKHRRVAAMNPIFKQIFFDDIRKSWSKKKIFLYIAVLIFLSIVLQNGINRYKMNLQDTGTFKEIERVKTGLIQNYSTYGNYGIRLLSSPPPLSVLFPAYLCISHVDTGVGMTISDDLKRDGLLVEIKGFAGLVVFFLLFIAILHGTAAFQNREVIKFYNSLNREITFWATLASRFIQITLINTIIFFIAVIQGIINDVWIAAGSVVIFWGILEIGVLGFLALGMTADFFMQKQKMVFAISFFFILLVIIPWQMDEFNRFRAESFKVELENLKYLYIAEKRITKEAGRTASKGPMPKEILDIIESSLKNEYAKMKANENYLLGKYITYVRRKQLYASFLPTTFLLSVSRELSGGGHIALIQFNRFTQDTREKFIRYYIRKEYHEDSEKGKVIPFPGEQVFKPGPALPYYAGWGIFISLVYAVGLVLLARYGFKHRLVIVPKKKQQEMRDLKIPLQNKTVNDFFTMDDQVKDHIYLEFVNNPGSITLDGKPLTGTTGMTFTYLPALHHLPDGAPALLGIEPGKSSDSWENLLEAALKRGIVLTDWNLYEFVPAVKEICRKGVYLNMSKDFLSSFLGENHLKWPGDSSIKHLDLYSMADFVNKHS